jgi:hypothetical protein
MLDLGVQGSLQDAHVRGIAARRQPRIVRIARHSSEPRISHHGRRGQGRVVQGDGQALVDERKREAGAHGCGSCTAVCRGRACSSAGLRCGPRFVHGRPASIRMDSVVHTGTSWSMRASVGTSKHATGLLATVTCVTSIQSGEFVAYGLRRLRSGRRVARNLHRLSYPPGGKRGHRPLSLSREWT